MKNLETLTKRESGLTLVELMVALVLGLLLMAGVLQLFAANKASYRLTESISGMQESARFGVSRLERDIRMAAYTGCTGRDQGNIVINTEFSSPPTTFTPDNGVEGWEASGTAYGSYTLLSDGASVSDASTSGWTTGGSVVLNGSTNAVNSSDVIRVWHVDGDGVLVDVSGSTVSAGTAPPYVDGDTMMLTDCTSVDYAHVCSVGTDDDADLACSENNPLNLLNSSGAAHAFKLSGSIYYVGKRADDADNPPALFRREISQNAASGAAGNPQELVQGVEALQLQYGIDTDVTDPDGVANAYVDANNVADWNDVVSVRVHLLMQSLRNDLVDGVQTFTFNGANVTASDGRLRYPFVATVSLRNRSR
jgi:type IV pilus assembly protein PilW